MSDFVVFLDRATPYIRDYSAIIVALVGAVIAILTYRRAKETVLQPVRTEVIKRQADLLMDLLAFLKDDQTVIDGVDYQGVIALNVTSSMLKCGAIFKDHQQVQARIKKETAGGILLTDQAESIVIVPVFDEEIDLEASKTNKPQNKHYKMAIAGKYTISELDITNSHAEFEKKYSEFRGNPLLPRKIIELLDKLSGEIMHNTTQALPQAVEDAINKSYSKKNTPFPNPGGVYNQFNRRRLSHSLTIEALRLEIRSYLKIDVMP